MRVSMVSTLNLDKLYEVCVAKQNLTENIGSLFSDNLYDIYNNVELCFMLNDVTIYEAFILKEFASYTTKLANKHFLYKSRLPMDAPNEIKKYTELLENISDDKGIHDVIRSSYPFLYGPCYLVQGDIIAKFTGKDLCKFFEKNPVDFFLKVTGGLCATQSNDSDNPGILLKPDYKLEHVSVSQHLSKMFMTKFYAYLNKRVTFADLVTDSVSHKRFTNHESLTKLSAIRHPFLEVNVKDLTNEELAKEVNNAKTKMVNDFNDDILSMTTIDIEVYSDFGTFLELFELLPKSMFIYKEDLKIPFKFKEIYIPEIFEPYYDKLEDRYTHLQEYIESINTNPMAMYQYTYLNSKFAYTISTQLRGVNLSINPLTKQKGLKPETSKVLNNIVKYALAAYNLV